MYSIDCLRLASKGTLLYHFYSLGKGDKRIIKKVHLFKYVYNKFMVKHNFKIIKALWFDKKGPDWSLDTLSDTLTLPLQGAQP